MPGKRARAAMRRTTSLTELGGGAESSRDQRPPPGLRQRPARRSSAECSMEVETAPFLKACGMCRRRLGPGRDTFMYRGDIAFCSLECRQQQMNLDERMEKCSLTSMKMEAPPPTTGSEASSGGETVAAA